MLLLRSPPLLPPLHSIMRSGGLFNVAPHRPTRRFCTFNSPLLTLPTHSGP